MQGLPEHGDKVQIAVLGLCGGHGHGIQQQEKSAATYQQEILQGKQGRHLENPGLMGKRSHSDKAIASKIFFSRKSLRFTMSAT
jgi:hypothetical protein